MRAHLEEDAAKTVHVGGRTGRIGGADHSLVDFNRGGTPLVEIVTAPDIHSAEEAKRFLQLLRQTIVELGISDAEMEKGTLRVDANVSVRPTGTDELRTRCEIKNMNSFTFIGRGIEAEIERQIGIWESGGVVEQQTFDFDAASGALTARRAKEEADDYRYFPEPDLVPLEPEPELVERLRGELPELAGGADRAPPDAARPRPGRGARRRRVGRPMGRDGRGGSRSARRRECDRQYRRRRWRRPARGVRGRLAKLIEARERDPTAGVRRGDLEARRSPTSPPSRTSRRRRWQTPRRSSRSWTPSSRPTPAKWTRTAGQGRAVGVLRRPGDEGDEGPGERSGGERARAAEARRLSAGETLRRCPTPLWNDRHGPGAVRSGQTGV